MTYTRIATRGKDAPVKLVERLGSRRSESDLPRHAVELEQDVDVRGCCDDDPIIGGLTLKISKERVQTLLQFFD